MNRITLIKLNPQIFILKRSRILFLMDDNSFAALRPGEKKKRIRRGGPAILRGRPRRIGRLHPKVVFTTR